MVQFNDNLANTKANDRRYEEEERFVQSMAPRLGYDYIFLRGYPINPEAIPLIPEKRARELQAVCFDVRQRELSIAAKAPNTPKIQALVQEFQMKKYTVTTFMCSSQSLEHAWHRYADVVETTAEKKGVFEIDTNTIETLTKSITTVADVETQLQQIRTANNARRISETLELIFAGALALRASDVHIEPEAGTVRVRYRFDGVLHDITSLDPYTQSTRPFHGAHGPLP